MPTRRSSWSPAPVRTGGGEEVDGGFATHLPISNANSQIPVAHTGREEVLKVDQTTLNMHEQRRQRRSQHSRAWGRGVETGLDMEFLPPPVLTERRFAAISVNDAEKRPNEL